MDATYKLNWQGYSVMLLAANDADRIFHSFVVAVYSTEAANDFQFIF